MRPAGKRHGGDAVAQFGLGGIIGRFLAALALVAVTYNPTGRSFAHWIGATFPHIQPLQAVAGIALVGIWLFFVHATWRALGTLGVVLGLAFFAALIWLFVSWGWLSLANQGAMAWVGIVVVASLLTTGLCWALVQTKVSGQQVVDEISRH